MSSNLRAVLLALAAFGTYATHDAVVKHLGGTYSPLQVLFFTVLFGFPFATLQMIRETRPDTLLPKSWFWVGLRSAAIVFGGVFVFTAFSTLPFAQVYAVIFTAPLLVTVMAVPILGERVGWHRGIAVVVGLIGVLVALRPGAAPLGFGHVAAMIGAFAIALVSVITRKIGRSERSVVLLIYPMIANVAVLGVMMPSVYKPMPIQDLGLLASLAFMAWGAALLQIAAFARGEAGLIAPMQYSQMIWAVVYGALFFDEWPDQWTIIGTAIIVISGVYIVLRERRANSPLSQNPGRAEAGVVQTIRPSKLR